MAISLSSNPLTSEQWAEYFTQNGTALLDIPWHLGVDLTREEFHDLSTSLQEFQLGESSEGKHLIREGKTYAIRSGDTAYPRALGLFIAEEHRHARDLGRILDLAGIARIKHAWPDMVFRWLRHRAGLELSITILVTAEIIAKAYYDALHDASESEVLRCLCKQILRDEIKHIEFQAHQLAVLRSNASALALSVRRAFHKVLLKGTCVAVWCNHRRVFRRGGYSFHRFWIVSHKELQLVIDERISSEDSQQTDRQTFHSRSTSQHGERLIHRH